MAVGLATSWAGIACRWRPEPAAVYGVNRWYISLDDQGIARAAAPARRDPGKRGGDAGMVGCRSMFSTCKRHCPSRSFRPIQESAFDKAFWALAGPFFAPQGRNRHAGAPMKETAGVWWPSPYVRISSKDIPRTKAMVRDQLDVKGLVGASGASTGLLQSLMLRTIGDETGRRVRCLEGRLEYRARPG